ncbi:MAG: hypothetical protein RL662_918 [Bacteroidota bacterium]|jgi:D-sedoheptulose 7-phosphate isomerase
MDLIRKRIEESIATKRLILESNDLLELIADASAKLIDSFKNTGSVYFCGNGGSAADAQHLAAEFSGRFYYDRQPLSSDALHCNTSFITAVANDYAYDQIYARLISGIGRKGDVLVGLSTSGNSKNIVKAFEKCRELGIYTIALTGQGGGAMKTTADMCICVPSLDTPRIQESHIMIGHIICEIVESTLFPVNK